MIKLLDFIRKKNKAHPWVLIETKFDYILQ